MSGQAKKDFVTSSNCLFLYTSSTTHNPWTSYEVLSHVSSNGQGTFTLMMHESPDAGGYIETVVVGSPSGSAQPVILRGEPSCSGSGE